MTKQTFLLKKRKSIWISVVLLVSGFGLVTWGVGCGNGPTDPNQPPSQTSSLTYYGSIKPTLDTYCGSCHAQGGIGPFNLTNFADASKYKTLIKDSVETKRMPPWHADNACNHYIGDISLPEEKAKELVSWVEKGAPEGDANSYKAPEEKKIQGLSRVDLTLQMPVEYTPTKSPDDYRCFIVDWPYKETKFVTGTRVKPGNTNIVHHVIAFTVTPEKVAEYEELDSKEEGPGYTCFGGAGGRSASGLGSGVGFLSGWAPGSPGGDFPKGTGTKIVPGSKIILQVHYNVSTASPAPDRSSIEIKVDDTVENEGRTFPFANPSWLGSKLMHIPAGQTDVLHKFNMDLASLYGKSILIHSATLHMHMRGKSGKLYIEREDGSTQCLLNIPKWDFNWQRPYGFKEPVKLNPKDKIHIECNFDNSPGRQPIVNGKRADPIDVYWGEGTNDEMCLGFFYMTNAPK